MICSNSFSGFGGPGTSSAPVLILCGGFLGAGKTTAITALARKLMQNGLRVALIVNDQAGGLVDQASALATGSPAVGEVAGGCFCCKLSAFTETLNQLGKDHQPDVFFAEPVGSCTDIVATVVLPLREIYGERVRVAPFSVLADCRRVIRELCPEAVKVGGKKGFSKNVSYIFAKHR